jgi:hypothetical protein
MATDEALYDLTQKERFDLNIKYGIPVDSPVYQLHELFAPTPSNYATNYKLFFNREFVDEYWRFINLEVMLNAINAVQTDRYNLNIKRIDSLPDIVDYLLEKAANMWEVYFICYRVELVMENVCNNFNKIYDSLIYTKTAQYEIANDNFSKYGKYQLMPSDSCKEAADYLRKNTRMYSTLPANNNLDFVATKGVFCTNLAMVNTYIMYVLEE